MILFGYGIDRRALVEDEREPRRSPIQGSLQGLRSLLRQASNLSDEPPSLLHPLDGRPARQHPEREGKG